MLSLGLNIHLGMPYVVLMLYLCMYSYGPKRYKKNFEVNEIFRCLYKMFICLRAKEDTYILTYLKQEFLQIELHFEKFYTEMQDSDR